MNRSIFDIQADFCRAMANGSRLQILHVLREHPLRVADIAQATGLLPSVVSRQLGILRNTGVVRGHRQGQEIVYQLTDENIAELCDLVRKVLSEHAQRRFRVFDEDLP